MISGMSVSLLVRHQDTGQLHVNFDQSIHQLLKETEHFRRLGLEVPSLALKFLERSEAIVSNYNSVKVCIECVCANVHTYVRTHVCAPVCTYIQMYQNVHIICCVCGGGGEGVFVFLKCFKNPSFSSTAGP